MTELATIKLHFHGSYSEQEKIEGERYIREFIDPIASSIFRQDVNIDFRSRDGSLEIYITIAGSIYAAIASYGSFRSGLTSIRKDAKLIHKILHSDILKNGINKNNIKSSRADNHLISKVLLLLKRVEKIQNTSNYNKNPTREAELIHRKLEELLRETTLEADRLLILQAVEEARDGKNEEQQKSDSSEHLQNRFYRPDQDKSELDIFPTSQHLDAPALPSSSESDSTSLTLPITNIKIIRPD